MGDPIYVNVKNGLTNIVSAKGSEKARVAQEVMTPVRLQEAYYLKRIHMLEKAVKSGNELFDFFADVYINEAVSRPVMPELAALDEYLSAIMGNHMAPHSTAMTITKDDNLLRVEQ